MRYATRGMLAMATILMASSFAGAPAADKGEKDEKDEMVVNPLYKFWANCKPGSTVTLLEKTALGGPEKETVPDGVDTKEVTTKLLSVTPEKVVVEVVVTEHEFLGAIESAPTKKIYPAKIKKSHLQAGLHGIDPKRGEEALEVLGEKLTCQTLAGTEKKDEREVEHKVWVSDKVPGGIVKHTRVTKQDGKLVADTTITVTAFKQAE
jgi:hypothetical protein